MTSRSPSSELLQMLCEYAPNVGEIALALRELVLKEAPTATELVVRSYAVAMVYSLNEKWSGAFCHVVAYTRHVNLGFNRGTELDDPHGLLTGSGKLVRHIKVESIDELKKPHLRSFIRAAIKHAKADLASKPPPRRARPSAASAKKKRK